MKTPLYVLTMFIGVVLTVHLAMNGKVGVALNNARVANALFWCIGAVGAVLIGMSGWQAGLAGLKNVHPVLLTAGLMGTTLVFVIAWVIPQIGAGPMTFSLGSPVQPVSAANVLGALLMLGGVYLATRT
jgi:transporter family-2 protein